MKHHHTHHHHVHPAVHHAHSLAERFLLKPDWPLRDAGSATHHALSLTGPFVPLLALAAAAAALIAVWRVWGRHRLAAAGAWFELRLGEHVERAALDALTRTLAGALPRPLLGAALPARRTRHARDDLSWPVAARLTPADAR